MNFNFRKSNKKQRNQSRQVQNDYQKLEPRCLLAVEVGLNFTGTVEGVETLSSKPDIAGAVGPDHIVEMVNTRFTVYDKTTGTELMTKSLDDFWVDAGADLDFSTTSGARLVYDPPTDRWFATSHDEGVGNTIYVGISETNDPMGTWDSVQFIGDTDGTQIATRQSLAVDANGVYIGSNNVGFSSDVSIFSIPKTDLLADEPALANITKFEGLDQSVYGSTIQVALDYNMNATRAIAIGADAAGGTSLYRTDIVGSFGPAANIAPVVNITVPEYMPAPGARQPSGVLLQNVTPDFTSNVIRNNGSLWLAHTVEGSDNNSAIRWYRINESTNELINWGTLEDTSEDYTNPSIAVNDFGVITIGYTVSSSTQFPSAEVIMGYTTNGLRDPQVTFEEPEVLRNGLADFEFSETSTNFWGNYSSTQVDPLDPFSFWTFQEYALTDNHWGTRIAESGLIDLEPTLRGEVDGDVIRVIVSEQNPDWIEVQMDGDVTDVFENRGLTTLNIDAVEGDDTLVLDYANGNPNPNTGITLRGGDGFDIVQVVNGTTGNDWVINTENGGFLDTITRFRDAEQIEGSGFADTYLIQNDPGTMSIYGGAGPDFFDVTKPITGDVDLFGETGDDEYRISLLNISDITVNDTIGSESDRLEAIATPGDDQIDINGTTLILNTIVENGFDFPGVETLAVDGLGGNDTFLVRATNQDMDLFGDMGEDSFYIGSAVPGLDGNLDGIFEVLNIDGGANRNMIVVGAGTNDPLDVMVTDSQLKGFTDNGNGVINYTATDGSFSSATGGFGITLSGSENADHYSVQSLLDINSLRIESGDGVDRIDVSPNVLGNVELDGQGDTDIYRLTMTGETNRKITIPDTGTGIFDRDRVQLGLTEEVDEVRFFDGFMKYNSEELIYGFPNEVLIVNAKGGDDVITFGLNTQDYIRFIAGDGDDTVNVNGSRGVDGYRFDLGAGADTVNMNSSSKLTFFGISGEAGDDTLNVSETAFSDIVFDGGEDSDVANIDNIGRTNRYINTKDSGVAGDDSVNINGTSIQDRYVVRPTSVVNRKETVVFDANTENLKVEAGNGNDIVEIFGSQAANTRIMTGAGNDLAFVNRTIDVTTMILDTGSDADNVTVNQTDDGSTFVYTQSGDDTIMVGSTFADDNGNLSKIRGNLRLFGGGSIGEDRLLINDHGAFGAYGYNVTNSMVSNLNDGTTIARPDFAGIRFDSSIEFVRVDGTDQNNKFHVTPSTTRVHIDGNLENSADTLTLLGGGDGRQLSQSGESGRWTFTNGFADVSFEEIEGASSASSNSPIAGSDGSSPQMMLAAAGQGLTGATVGNDDSDEDSQQEMRDAGFGDLDEDLSLILF